MLKPIQIAVQLVREFVEVLSRCPWITPQTQTAQHFRMANEVAHTSEWPMRQFNFKAHQKVLMRPLGRQFEGRVDRSQGTKKGTQSSKFHVASASAFE